MLESYCWDACDVILLHRGESCLSLVLVSQKSNFLGENVVFVMLHCYIAILITLLHCSIAMLQCCYYMAGKVVCPLYYISVTDEQFSWGKK